MIQASSRARENARVLFGQRTSRAPMNLYHSTSLPFSKTEDGSLVQKTMRESVLARQSSHRMIRAATANLTQWHRLNTIITSPRL